MEEERKNVSLATEMINDMQGEIDNILLEGESIREDLDRAKFTLNELLGIVMNKPQSEKEARQFINNQERMYMLTDMAYDYLSRISNDMTNLNIRINRNKAKSRGI